MTNTLFLSLEILSNDHIRVVFGPVANIPPFELAFDPIRKLADDTARRFSDAKPDELLAMGRALFDWLDEHERFTDALDQFPDDDQPIALAVTAPDTLAHLPWETLHDGTEFLVAREIRPVVPVRLARPRDHVALPEPANRPLRVLFMATSPEDIQPVLDFEKEEGDILAAADQAGSRFDLMVEESGTLAELRKTIERNASSPFDVVHLSGHADHDGETPVFLTEDDSGLNLLATPADIVAALSPMPPLVFLSGCKTAEAVRGGAAGSLAEQLIENGANAVLGWGRPVTDTIAIAAATAFYGSLSNGASLFTALVNTYRAMREEEDRLRKQNAFPANWHLLRLFVGESLPGAFVTTPDTEGRETSVRATFADEFLDPTTLQLHAVSRGRFVGRRRLLQHGLRALKKPDRTGVVLHGLGGNGKTSMAARLCDRLAPGFTPVVLIGKLTESDLLLKLDKALGKEETSGQLALNLERTEDLPFEVRFKNLLFQARTSLLFVLDDFERNYQNHEGKIEFDGNGAPVLGEEHGRVLSTLAEAVAGSGHRILITSRFRLDHPSGDRFEQFQVNTFKDTDLKKLVAAHRRELKERIGTSKELNGLFASEENAITLAAGNARLLGWLYNLLADPFLDLNRIIKQMQATRTELLESVLAEELLRQQPETVRQFLGVAAVYATFAPRSALTVLTREIAGIDPEFERASAIGLLETAPDPIEKGESVFLVPELLIDLLHDAMPTDETRWHERAATLLYDEWWLKEGRKSIPLADELVRLAKIGNLPKIAARAEGLVQNILANRNFYREAAERLKKLSPESLCEFDLETAQGRIARYFGEGDKAEAHFATALEKCPPDDDEWAGLLFYRADLLAQRGQLEEALACYRNELLPHYDRLGNTRSHAVTLGKVADILETRGELDQALRIRQEEELPVFEKLGDVRERAITLGKVADILFQRGELDEALRIRLDEQLPVFEQFDDEREYAVTLGKITDILFARGDLDEALRIRQEKELPVYEKLGDVCSRALARGKVADILAARGDLDEALRIRREEQLPVFEKLGDIHQRAVTLGHLADILFRRGDLDEALRIRREEQLPVFEKLGDVRERAVTLGKVADIFQARGDLDEALRIRREEQLPIFEKLGDVRSRAVTLSQVADILEARGELDQALQIHCEEALPVFEKLGDLHNRSVTLGYIADILAARGDLDEALRIRREELLPVFEKLGDVRERAITLGKVADILLVHGKLDEALQIRQNEELPVFEKLGDVHQRAVTLGYISDILAARGDFDEALRIRREELLPVFEKLGDVRSRAVTLGKVADILFRRGDLDQALRIRLNEELPVFEKLGDVRERAVTLGQVADILFARGDLDDALRIRREELLPAFEKLGDVRERAVTLGKVADILFVHGELDEALRIRQDEQLPVFEKLGDVRLQAITLGKVADILIARGELDEALRIRQNEELPVYEKLGDSHNYAITLVKVTDILFACAELDEALRVLKKEPISIFEKLGDIRSRAITFGKVADILEVRGDLDEALRIRQEEELPVFEQIGDVHSRAVTLGKIADILFSRGELKAALRIRRDEQLPVFEQIGDVRERALTLVKISRILALSVQFNEALRLISEAMAIFKHLQSPMLEIAREDFQEVLSAKVHSVIGDDGMKNLNALFATGQTDEANRIIQQALAQPDPN